MAASLADGRQFSSTSVRTGPEGAVAWWFLGFSMLRFWGVGWPRPAHIGGDANATYEPVAPCGLGRDLHIALRQPFGLNDSHPRALVKQPANLPWRWKRRDLSCSSFF